MMLGSLSASSLGSTKPPSDPNDCADLGATDNEQGKAIRHDARDISDDEGEFVHVEAESLVNANQAICWQ